MNVNMIFSIKDIIIHLLTRYISLIATQFWKKMTNGNKINISLSSSYNLKSWFSIGTGYKNNENIGPKRAISIKTTQNIKTAFKPEEIL